MTEFGSGFFLAMGVIAAFGLFELIKFLFTYAFGTKAEDKEMEKAKKVKVIIVIDPTTGLQYYQSSLGGITPRMGTNGQQISEDDDS